VNRAVLRHYLDGIQFAMGDLQASTTPVTFDPMSVFDQQRLNDLLLRISTYRYGDSRAALTALEDFIRSVGDLPEARLRMERQFGEILDGDATPSAKQFLCSKLALIGSDESVPRLARMLADTSTAEMALFALEQIPGEAADDALRQALRNADARTTVGIVTALGSRRVDGATGELEALVKDPDNRVSAASVSALGRIGTTTALEALHRSTTVTNGRSDVLDAMLAIADRIRLEGDREQALGVYRDLNSNAPSLPVRCAALRGIVLADPENAPEVLRDGARVPGGSGTLGG
jgi:HEAT repeat protein